ncbi:MAG: hypothetical protein ACUVT3_05485 [Ignavibacterium sp.]
MKQSIIYNLIYLLLVILFIFFPQSCKEESNPVDNNSVFSSTTKTVTTASGGTLEISDKDGNQIKLIIPPLAVKDTTEITLEILNSVKPNPFSQNILTTLRIMPDGLKLDSAGTIKIIFSSDIPDTSKTVLYYSKQSNLAYLLKSRWLNSRTIEASIFHFSEYGGAVPTGDEIVSQSQFVSQEPEGDIWDWQSFYDMIKCLIKYEEMLNLYAKDDMADELHEKIVQKVTARVINFMNQPIPEDPCGFYLKTLLKYHEMAILIGVEEQIIEQMSDRIGTTLNRCYTRGELEFAYDFCFSAEGGEICRTITGFIPFTVNTTIEPHGQINGSGDLDWNGTATGIPPNCFFYEVGTVNVTLGGNMVIDEYGVLWMDFDILEHAAGTVTTGCEGAPPQVYPFSPPDVTQQIRILAQDGSELIMPVPWATSGHFKWILHITFSR